MIDVRSIVSHKIEVLKQWKNCLRMQAHRYGFLLNNNDRKILVLKNCYKGRRAFIIGNGPSLSNTNVSLLKDEITIGSNGLFLMFNKMEFLPTFYTVEDRLVAEDRADTINRIKGTIKIFPSDLKYCLKPDTDTIYINFLRKYREFPQFSDRFESHVYWGGTVTMMNIQLAYYVGIREIYLVGVDHNYHSPFEEDEQEGTVITSHSNDVNHFHHDYFGPGYRYHDPKVERMEMAYKRAKEFVEGNGGVIYNATIGGKLEVFERVNYCDLFPTTNIK